MLYPSEREKNYQRKTRGVHKSKEEDNSAPGRQERRQETKSGIVLYYSLLASSPLTG